MPFELGRPLGPPNNPSIQSQVLESTLTLLTSDQGPSVLVDFDYVGGAAYLDPNWIPFFDVALPIEEAEIDLVRLTLLAEVASLHEAYTQAKIRRGRTTVGVAQLSMDEILDHIVWFFMGPHEKSLRDVLLAVMVPRYGADYLKAYYNESATTSGHYTSWQLGNWFWRHTSCR